MLHDDRDGGGYFVHPLRRHTTEPAHEALNVHPAHLQNVSNREFGQTVLGVRLKANEPDAVGESILPLGDRRDQLDRQTPHPIGTHHNGGASFANLGPAGRIKTDHPDITANWS